MVIHEVLAQTLYCAFLGLILTVVISYLYEVEVWVQCYKTFNGRNLRIFVIS